MCIRLAVQARGCASARICNGRGWESQPVRQERAGARAAHGVGASSDRNRIAPFLIARRSHLCRQDARQCPLRSRCSLQPHWHARMARGQNACPARARSPIGMPHWLLVEQPVSQGACSIGHELLVYCTQQRRHAHWLRAQCTGVHGAALPLPLPMHAGAALWAVMGAAAHGLRCLARASATSAAVMAAGDLACQGLQQQEEAWAPDWARTARFGAIGATLHGPLWVLGQPVHARRAAISASSCMHAHSPCARCCTQLLFGLQMA